MLAQLHLFPRVSQVAHDSSWMNITLQQGRPLIAAVPVMSAIVADQNRRKKKKGESLTKPVGIIKI
jgi:hypothetical protein